MDSFNVVMISSRPAGADFFFTLSTNNLTRQIKEHQLTLEKSHKIKVSFSRTNAARLIILSKVTGDSVFTGTVPSPMERDGNDDMGVSDKLPSPVTNTEETAKTQGFLSDGGGDADE